MFVGATIITLMHYWRVRRFRALPLAGMFALLAMARLNDGKPLQFWCDLLAGASGLAHLGLLVPRHAPERD
jgi:hypothetical protein